MVRIREDNGVSMKVYERGFPVGFKAATEEGGEEKYFLHNHVRFTILYHKDIETDLARIVGFEVEPASVHHTYATWDEVMPQLDTCTPEKHPLDSSQSTVMPQIVTAGETLET